MDYNNLSGFLNKAKFKILIAFSYIMHFQKTNQQTHLFFGRIYNLVFLMCEFCTTGNS